MQNVLTALRLHCHKSVRYPKKMNLVHQTVFPHERVGSGDETTCNKIQCSQTCLFTDTEVSSLNNEPLHDPVNGSAFVVQRFEGGLAFSSLT